MIRLMKTQRLVAFMGLLSVLLLAAVACSTTAPDTQIVERDVVVTKEVPKIVEKTVTEIVEKTVTEVVTKEVPKIVEKTVTEVVTKEVIKNVAVAPPPAEKKTIVFSDLSRDSAQLQNRIAMYIVKNGYGYPVDTVLGNTTALQTSLLNADTQVTMEIRLPKQQEWWDKATMEASVIPMGKSLDDNWRSAFVVPTYVVEQNPELKSVKDLPKFKDLFVTPDSNGKARLVSCVIGWACEKSNEGKIAAYGLEDTIELVTPSSAAALFADLEMAYEKGEPWLGYLWGPTKTAAELDLTVLEEPACAVGASPETGCAYPDARVLIAVHPSLIARAPDVVEFLRKWDFAASTQLAAESWMADNNATHEEAAVWFLKNKEAAWTKWVTSEAADKVKEALAKES